MVKSRVIWLILFLFPGAGCFAQQYNNWYFGGRSAISFSVNNNQPVPYAVNNSMMVSDEAAAAVSDENGNLLFYTNGITIYNRQHQVMLNGDNIMGNASAVQIAIVQQPGSDSLFYLFTTDAVENDMENGYRYAVIDMDQDNGNGQVISKNALLWQSCTERLTTARHANGIDIWVITNDMSSNTFRSWLVTCNGLQASAVVSFTGDVLNAYRDIEAGAMKVSPDGKFLAQTHFPFLTPTNPSPNFCQLFNFDNATGVISNPIKITFPSTRFTHCEFSPDAKLLYLSRPYENKIDQVEITLPTLAAILASRVTLPASNSIFDMQLGPDEKIYCSSISTALSAIQKPNTRGAGCSFAESLVPLSGSSYIGLPQHINDFVFFNDPNNGFSYTILDSCTGRVQFNARTTMPAPVIWEWDFGDGQTSSLQNPLHIFSVPAKMYSVKLKIRSQTSCGFITKTKQFTPSGAVNTKAGFSFVARCDSGYIRFINTSLNQSNPGISFEWHFGDGQISTATHPVHTYANPGNYTVKLKVNTGLTCLNDSVLLPVAVKGFSVRTIPDQVIMVGQPVYLSTDEPAETFSWSPAQWLSDSAIRNPVATPLQDIVYTVSAANGDGCKGKDAVFIRVIQYNDVYVPTAFTPNNDGKNDIIMPYFPGDVTLKNFSIFNRWGQRIFSTAQRSTGWDGKVNGVIQQTGVFAWSIQLTNTKGEFIERKGVLTLIQ